jgi:hypothetical protein
MVSWCLSEEVTGNIKRWGDIPDDLWMSLCIPHQRAIVELYNVDIRRLERAKRYWEQRFSKEGQAVKEDIQG